MGEITAHKSVTRQIHIIAPRLRAHRRVKLFKFDKSMRVHSGDYGQRFNYFAPVFQGDADQPVFYNMSFFLW